MLHRESIEYGMLPSLHSPLGQVNIGGGCGIGAVSDGRIRDDSVVGELDKLRPAPSYRISASDSPSIFDYTDSDPRIFHLASKGYPR